MRRDFAVITRDPATVAGMAATFTTDFATTVAPTPRLVPPGSHPIWSPGAEPGLVDLIGSARAGTTLHVETEQLDSAPLEQALIGAAKRGVTVDLTMTTQSAYTTALDTLKAGGVRVSLGVPVLRATGLRGRDADGSSSPGEPCGRDRHRRRSARRPSCHRPNR
jgi:cardiolipin synthase A/B